jgi:succinate dehydrogenase / fumarate reductase flavoprotein subunit
MLGLRGVEPSVAGDRAQGVARGHFRTDYPERNDDEWLKHIDLNRNGDDTPEISYSPVTITKWQPEERKY